MNPNIKGALYAIIAASLWGVSGTFVQFLNEEKQVDPAWLITVRMFSAGLTLVIVAALTKDKGVWNIWKDVPIRNRLLIFSITGMFSVQYFFFMAIQHSNAATATIIQYIGPVLIAVYYSFVQKKLPTAREFLAIVLALLGTFLLVTHGNISNLIISPVALTYGILSAIALAVYTVQPIAIMKKYSPIVVVGWSMLIGSILACIIKPIWQVEGTMDAGAIGSILFILVLGTVIPFSLFLSAVKKIGAQKSSLISCFEPLSAALIAVFWLGVQMLLIDWVGAICIMLTVFLLTKPKKQKQPAVINLITEEYAEEVLNHS
ncbi:DMT family transporter [Gynurincola endophyticus]|uniref:DMT family transporter n=1 Tax=Gynurincola endophyticus TaxID=2479004 RepID=UPI000F8C57A2|nr:EamA family transporter [Gynurincola endophyticus]